MKTGDIQVICKPELKVYCDNNFIGKSTHLEDGKYVRDVEKGRHLIKLEFDEHTSHCFEVEVIPDQIVKLDVEKSSLKLLVEEDNPDFFVRQVVGSLKIFSIPVNCEVHFLDQIFHKKTPTFTLRNVPIGTYPIKFIKKHKELEAFITIRKRITIEIKADFLEEKIINLTDEERKRLVPFVIKIAHWDELEDYSKRFFFDSNLQSMETIDISFNYKDKKTCFHPYVPITVKNSQLEFRERLKNKFIISPKTEAPVYLFLPPNNYRLEIDGSTKRKMSIIGKPGSLYNLKISDTEDDLIEKIQDNFVSTDNYTLDREGYYM